jgi:hypothetical protein
MTSQERQDMLTYENTLAEERDRKAREFQLESERRREAQEKEIRKQTELTEKQRVAELEAMEAAAAGAAEGELDSQLADTERRISSMWSALGTGTQPGETTTTDTSGTGSQRPK